VIGFLGQIASPRKPTCQAEDESEALHRTEGRRYLVTIWRTSTAPPSRAAGMRAATSIA
jgi:hypothetical protein